MTNVFAVIPVGPKAAHAQWLDECIESVVADGFDGIVIVDDMAGVRRLLGLVGGTIEKTPGRPTLLDAGLPSLWLYEPPWLLGVTSAFNHGTKVAHGLGADLALMLGADDLVRPGCATVLRETYEAEGRREGYYWLDVESSDGAQQALPCNAAATTAGLWELTGGLPIEAERRAPDAVFMSAMLVNMPDILIHAGGGPFYWWRLHEAQETARRVPEGAELRDYYAAEWKPPEFGRYE